MLVALLTREIRSAITFAFVSTRAVRAATLLPIIMAHCSLLSARPMRDPVQPFMPQASDEVLST